MVLNLALSYGGRDEIVDAVKSILRDSKSIDIDESAITKDFFQVTSTLPIYLIRIC